MVSWIQIVIMLVALAGVAGIVLWIHRAAIKNLEKGARERDRRL